MRAWKKVCGGPAVLAMIGFFLLWVVEYFQVGSYLETFRIPILYGSQSAFVLGLAWALRNLWLLLKDHGGKGQA